MNELSSLLGYVNCAVFLFTAFSWYQAVENRKPSEPIRSFLWDAGAAFDESRFMAEGHKHRRRFVGGMTAFLAILLVLLVIQVGRA